MLIFLSILKISIELYSMPSIITKYIFIIQFFWVSVIDNININNFNLVSHACKIWIKRNICQFRTNVGNCWLTMKFILVFFGYFVVFAQVSNIIIYSMKYIIIIITTITKPILYFFIKRMFTSTQNFLITYTSKNFFNLD